MRIAVLRSRGAVCQIVSETLIVRAPEERNPYSKRVFPVNSLESERHVYTPCLRPIDAPISIESWYRRSFDPLQRMRNVYHDLIIPVPR